MDGRAWQATVHRVAKRWTRLSDFTFTFTWSSAGEDFLVNAWDNVLHVYIIKMLIRKLYLISTLYLFSGTVLLEKAMAHHSSNFA